jgi:deoxyribodipyrimidine photo-lyase
VPVPAVRIRALNDRPIDPGRAYVLYWMTAFRRLTANFALERAVEIARQTGCPLLIFEPIRVDYAFASDRLHRFVLEGMAEHAQALEGTPVTYLPYVEPSTAAAHGLLHDLASRAVAVVADDYPCFFLPRMLESAARQVDARLECVDSNGLLPVRETSRTFATALSFRAHMQRSLPAQVEAWPSTLNLRDLPAPAADLIPESTRRRWPPASPGDLANPDSVLARLPIDHSVSSVPLKGGATAASAHLRRFLKETLPVYADRHSHPDEDATSRLSPWLHFGHISAHQVFEAVMTHERWTSRSLGRAAGGKRAGWWGVSAGADAFLDQLITWREIGFNMCVTRPADYWTFGSLPIWALATLEIHSIDPRAPLYSENELAEARTHDAVWNAAQRQLERDGWMHNYLRMLWGKKILEWTASPREALDTMTRLMNRYALDGRDPNSYSGYAWTLGRYDRPWAPERAIFGTVRYMSSTNTAKKLRMKNYLHTYGDGLPL